MPNTKPAPLTADELSQALRAADPSVLLVPPRILRRAIRTLGGCGGAGLHVPHRKSFVCRKDQLLTFADPLELGLAGSLPSPEILILLPRPNDEALRAPRGDLLRKYWRLLFHSSVHRAFLTPDGRPRLTDADVRDRIHALGCAEFDEARTVLTQERFLAGASDDRATYEELVAVFFEIRRFVPWLLPLYFPSFRHPERTERLLSRDVDADADFTASRLAGAADSRRDEEKIANRRGEGVPGNLPQVSDATTTGDSPARFLADSERAALVGNLVRAALLASRATHDGTNANDSRARAAERDVVARLNQRIESALRLGPDEAVTWRELVPGLLPLARRGVWSPEARFLYDLQKVCLDGERTVYQLDVVGWLLTAGRRPVKRALPGQSAVLALKHLRVASKRLTTLRVGAADRRRLARLLDTCTARAEDRVRTFFRPVIREALDAVPMRPANFLERVALDKLIEELLDRITEHGFVTMGDLRDAVSRNQLKLPDLGSFGEFVRGDPLIRTNRRLAAALDGVYHRGEVYLRGLQRLSSAAFGTRPGRFLTRYVALPFGGAYFALMGTQLLVEEVTKLVADENAKAFHLLNWYSFAAAGLFLFAVLHVPAFRRHLAGAVGAAARGGHWLLFELPAAAARLPVVREFLHSPVLRWFGRYVAKPAAYAVPASAVFPLLGAGPLVWSAGGAALLLLMSGLLNSRWGRNLEEALQEGSLRVWRQVHLDSVLGLFWFVVDLFRRAVETMERGLYTVDEWLRFRSGETRLTLVGKAVLGVGWFLLTYLIRLFINLFVEPTFNPIKHFPVVTVAAKLILPVLPQLTKALMNPLTPLLGKALAGSIAGLGVFFLPGLAGFLVWEFKENWRLYKANRAKTLRPVMIGHHGETMPRLLRPGFHSGTLPKLFAKLRKSRRRAERTGRWKSFRKQKNALHHVEESIRRFVDRELLPLVNAGDAWRCRTVAIKEVFLSTNQVTVELNHTVTPPATGRITFWEHGRTLVAELEEPAWLLGLGPKQRTAFAVALAGFYDLAGVSAVANSSGVPAAERTTPVESPDGRPLAADIEGEGPASRSAGTGAIAWVDWVETWEQLLAGKDVRPAFAERLLPAELAANELATAPVARAGH